MTRLTSLCAFASLRLWVNQCLLAALLLAFCVAQLRAADEKAPVTTNDFSSVQAIFDKHCVDCHSAQEPEAKLVMENFETLMNGGESGAVIIPGKSAESLVVKMIEGSIEKEGKKVIMPPGKRKKLGTNEIAAIKAWIDSGAKPPAQIAKKEIEIPKIEPKVPPQRGIHSLAYSPSNKLIAVGRYGEVELISAATRARVRALSGHRGAVNALVFSGDGTHVFAAAGDAGISGEVRQWNVTDGKLVRVFEGHSDALYAAAISPDGKLLATGSYDQKIKLWNIETGEETKTLSGHNGGVFGLAFRPDGKILASASADRTIKLWNVANGERRDTLSQPLKEQYAVAFSRDGKQLVAGGADNRIRVWEISENAAETTNPLLEARFAHEGAILRLVYSASGNTLASSADDRTVKLWNAAELKEKLALEKQPDWPTGLTLVSDPKVLVVGRLDGTLEFYDSNTGKIAPPPSPALAYTEPRGIQRGVETKIRLVGTNLVNLTEFRSANSNLTGRIVREGETDAWAEVKASADLRPGPYEIWVSGGNGESGKVKLYVDTLPQVVETNRAATTNVSIELPVNVWASFDPKGDADQYGFDAKPGQTIVFDLQAKALGSKANPVLTLLDASGKVLASNNDFDGTDALLAHKFSEGGRYGIRVTELTLAGSPEHFYRLTVGQLPYVAGCFPLSAPIGKESEITLVGYNLPESATVRVKAEKAGDLELPIDPEKFRTRRTFKVAASDLNEVLEVEPNDKAEQATTIAAPGSVGGRIWSQASGSDADLFRFEAKKDQVWIIETMAAQKGSPVDTRIEILYADGKPVERMLLQAVRDTMINFRAIDSNASGARLDNWEEMELNQYLYLNGEVVRLFRMPQGPDSDMLFYTLKDKRRTYFDSTAIAHALEEPGYIVEAHPPGAKVAATGLPSYVIYYSNDDEPNRKLGTDSRVFFTAPKDGVYLARITDTRGDSGERFAYRLMVREPKPDFKVTVQASNLTINAGSGHEFTASADRIDGFDEDITVHVSNLPAGFTASSPIVIQAGHHEAKGTLNAALDAPQPEGSNASMARVTATAKVNGVQVTNDVKNFGGLKLGEQPKLFVMFEPHVEDSTNSPPLPKQGYYELTIAPGQAIPAMLRIKRNGHEDLVTFTVENLPHGVIVDNIGLNGVLIPKGENERQISIIAAKWVPETDRWCFAIEGQAGKQPSLPVLIHVRKPGSKLAAAAQ